MNIIRKLTFRSMKKNKLTSLMILFGVILSVALMTVLVLFTNSVYRFFRDDVIKKQGDAHVLIGDIRREQLESLPNQELIEKMSKLSLIGVEHHEKMKSSIKHIPLIGVAEEDMKSSLPLQIVAGRLPSSQGEAVITESVNRKLENASRMIGQNIVIDLYQPDEYVPREIAQEQPIGSEEPLNRFQEISYEKDRAYPIKIVGIVKDLYRGQIVRAPLYLVYQTQEEITSSNRLCAGVSLKEITTHKLDTFMNGLKGIEGIVFNPTQLTEYYPDVRSDMSILINVASYVLLLLVALAAMALIQNGFLISFSRRVRSLSVLASVGMTRRQEILMSLTEGMALYVIGLPLGISLGFLFALGFFRVTTPKLQIIQETDVKMQLLWDPQTLFKIAIAALLALLLASIIPVMKTSRRDPLKGVLQRRESKLKVRKLREPKFVSRWFGIEGAIAWKNHRRNRQHFRGPLVALVICMVLFLSLSSLSLFMNLMFERVGAGVADISVDGIKLKNIEELATYESILRTEGIKDGYFAYVLDATFHIDVDQYAQGYHNQSPTMDVAITSFDKVTMDLLLDDWKLTREDLSGHHAVLVNELRFNEDGRFLNQKIFDAPPSSLRLKTFADYNKVLATLDVTHIVSESIPFFDFGDHILQIIVLPELLESFVKQGLAQEIDVKVKVNTLEGQQHEMKMKLQSILREKNLQGYAVDSKASDRKTAEALAGARMIINIFLAMVVMVVFANIYQVLSVSLRNRHPEFAVLRSIGMDNHALRKMLRVEGYFYSMKIVLYSLPLSVFVSVVFYHLIKSDVYFPFRLPYLAFILIMILIVGLLMLIMQRESRIANRDNILDALKLESDF